MRPLYPHAPVVVRRQRLNQPHQRRKHADDLVSRFKQGIFVMKTSFLCLVVQLQRQLVGEIRRCQRGQEAADVVVVILQRVDTVCVRRRQGHPVTALVRARRRLQHNGQRFDELNQRR